MGNLKNLMYGLYYSYQQHVVFLPLLEVRAEASVKELAAQVKLTQTYGNDASFLVGAKYSFPIPARAAVCSFAMIKQDGTRVVGSVQEKLEARKTYDTAVSQGQQASLVEQQTPDVFQVSVGNIPANEQVQIELVYATELSEDEENDAVRFHLPIHIGARYGKAPDGLRSAALSSAPFLTITTSVETLAPISKISSPSHTVSTEFGPDPALPNFKDLPFSKYARVSLSSNSTLDKDFILTIKSTDLDAPRCVAELHLTHDTAALALTFVPRFALPDLARQEFILLVDRSGSMSGARIAAARKALVILLRALPHKDTLFQLTSFGNHATSLWPQGSRAYNQATLEEATAHVDGMSADYGGTEIRLALDHVFWCRARDRPTSVLLLTDGDAWDLKGVLDTVKKAVEGAPDKAPLRVSVLGIGNSASTAMCEGIARVGNGTCMLVGEQEASFAGKVARLLKAARTPVIQDISVDWGRGFVPTAHAAEPEEDFEMVEDPDAVGTEKKTLNIFDEEVDPTHLDETTEPVSEVILPPPAKVQQSPFKIRNLFPGTRVNIYAILQSSKTLPLPGYVTLRGSTPDGAEIALRIAVTLSRLPHALGAPPALHALAARKIIQDLEDGQHAVPETLINPADADLLTRTVRTHIVRLGTTYQIMSTHTSFVAVDEAAHEGPLPPHPISITEPVQRDEVVLSALLQTPPMVTRKPTRRDATGVRPSGSRPVAPKLQISGGRPRYYVAYPGSDSSDAEDTGAYYGGPINSCISNSSNPTRPRFSKPSLSLNLAYVPPPLPSASNLPPPLHTVPPSSDAHDILPALSAVGPSSSQSAPAPTQNMTRAECLAYACAEANRRVDARVAAPSPPQSPDDLLSPALSDSLMPTRKTTSLTPEECEDFAQADAASVRVEARIDAFDLSSTPPPVPPHSQPQSTLMPTPQSTTREERLASLRSKSHSRMTTPSEPSPLENFDDLLARFLSPGTALASTSTTRTTSTFTFSPDSPDMPAAPPAADMLEALARLQDFDGAFPSPFAVFALVPLKAGSTLDNVRRALALPAGADVLVGSVLALAFLGAKLKMGVEDSEKELGVDEAERDAWAAMYEKARDWVEAALRDRGVAQTVEELEAKVAGILAIA